MGVVEAIVAAVLTVIAEVVAVLELVRNAVSRMPEAPARRDSR